MSFLYCLTHNIIPNKKIVHSNRKEKIDSHVARIKISLINYIRERASAFTSRGSLTLEAAIVVPVFFFAMLSLAYLLEMMSIQTTVRNALCSAGREAAENAYVSTLLTPGQLENKLVENIGPRRLEESIIAEGANGLNCNQTKSNLTSGIMDLSVCYQIEIPVLMFRIKPVSFEETLRIKGWNGYTSTPMETEGKEIVYVTETGLVYHKDAHCTYLDMSVHGVLPEDIEGLRNQSGGRYYPCEACGNKSADTSMFFITDYGTRYHTSLECKKIKRKIYAISPDEAYGLGGCSKCVK